MALLTDSTAVVTGGASGNGRAIAMAFAEHGADVVVADLQREPRTGGDPTDERIVAETDARATFVECDVSDRDDCRAAVDAAEAFGGVDVMVNNAGILRETPFLEVTEDELDEVLGVNLEGVFFGAQAAAEVMVERGEGRIINLSSVAGIEGAANNSTYCASKGGVRLLTYSLAAELGPEGVRVNAIHPGYIQTAMLTEDVPLVGTDAQATLEERIPQGRLGTPEDVAGAAVYLASDLAGYVNGESLVVDGGNVSTV
ncbi:SDR family oxidoreductase [Haloglomus litoreum]|uniref:SDR family oxidoreductase n=1 Tax=Haloglomus litoreum TaxID=3034026 RepID=UPI0023E88E89|nr:SDR family oxidoreductase [Haloglomus sp. DT116]